MASRRDLWLLFHSNLSPTFTNVLSDGGLLVTGEWGEGRHVGVGGMLMNLELQLYPHWAFPSSYLTLPHRLAGKIWVFCTMAQDCCWPDRNSV